MYSVEQQAIDRTHRIGQERPVVVDAGPTRGSKRLARDRQPEEKPKTGLAKWIANLQARAEQVQRDAQNPKRPRGQ